jgi:hypothetical protein
MRFKEELPVKTVEVAQIMRIQFSALKWFEEL